MATRARILADYVSGGATAAEFDYLDGVTSNIQTQFTAKAPLASPAFTGTPTGITASHILTGTFPAVVAQTGTVLVGTASAGQVGEYLNVSGWRDNMDAGVTYQISDGSGLTSLTLTAGDWDVSVSGSLYGAPSGSVSQFRVDFGQTAATATGYTAAGHQAIGTSTLFGSVGGYGCTLGGMTFRINLSASDEFFVNISQEGGNNTGNHGWGQASARRVR